MPTYRSQQSLGIDDGDITDVPLDSPDDTERISGTASDGGRRASGSARNSRSADGQRTLQSDVRRLGESLDRARMDAQRVLHQFAESQPYALTGIAAGVGFVLGGGLRTRAVPVILASVARMAGVWLTNELLDRSSDDQDEFSNEEDGE